MGLFSLSSSFMSSPLIADPIVKDMASTSVIHSVNIVHHHYVVPERRVGPRKSCCSFLHLERFRSTSRFPVSFIARLFFSVIQRKQHTLHISSWPAAKTYSNLSSDQSYTIFHTSHQLNHHTNREHNTQHFYHPNWVDELIGTETNSLNSHLHGTSRLQSFTRFIHERRAECTKIPWIATNRPQ